MGTSALIGKVNKDNTVTAIYVHYDGHLDTTGKELYTNFATTEKVDELLAVGDCSSILTGGDIKAINAYGSKATTYRNRADMMKECCDFVYFFNNDKWYVRHAGDKSKQVEKMLRAEGLIK